MNAEQWLHDLAPMPEGMTGSDLAELVDNIEMHVDWVRTSDPRARPGWLP